ncbi:neurotrypsin-like [Asterias amurensis]|uniref:neurotrypsin-like n=1 Tax=Asterias amurensis TaxID=7602 RepID=UPI003AB879A2
MMLWTASLMLALMLGVTNGDQDFDVRVTGGGKTGRVEVYYSNVWGVVCKEGWDFYDALVVCRQLGYEWVASGWSDVQASIGSKTAWLSGVQCDGTETNLDSCTGSGWTQYSCTNDAPATVACYDLDEVDGTTTSTDLLNGGNKAEGKVLMKLQPGVTDAKPYILCDDSWDKENADVICRQAGYHSAVMATSSSYFGVHDPEDEANFGGVEFLADRINCEGSESNVVVCPADDLPDGECDTGHEAGVSCNRIAEPEDFQLRLADGGSAIEGRVEVFMNGEWGSICKTNASSDVKLSYEETNVICQQAGQGYGVESPTDNRFGLSSLQAAMTGDFDCYGGEPSFAQCFNNATGTTPEECSGSSDRYEVSVICSGPVEASRQPIKQDGNVLLIYQDGRWRTVCNKDWTMANAKVACKELGMGPPDTAQIESNETKGGPIFVQTLSCQGDEETLDSCEKSEEGALSCYHRMDVAIACTPLPPVTTPVAKDNGGLAVTSDSASLVFAILTAAYCVFN